MQPPRLFIFAGLPGVGKSTLSRLLAREIRAVYLRVDTIEQALGDEAVAMRGPEGYVVAYKVAADNLRLGASVIADSVNPIQITREAWRAVAIQAGVPFVEIEVICSNPAEHKIRIETRPADIPGHRLPTWDEVQTRKRDPWDIAPLLIDTANATVSESFAVLLRMIEGIR
jgi:predicted kinase